MRHEEFLVSNECALTKLCYNTFSHNKQCKSSQSKNQWTEDDCLNHDH